MVLLNLVRDVYSHDLLRARAVFSPLSSRDSVGVLGATQSFMCGRLRFSMSGLRLPVAGASVIAVLVVLAYWPCLMLRSRGLT